MLFEVASSSLAHPKSLQIDFEETASMMSYLHKGMGLLLAVSNQDTFREEMQKERNCCSGKFSYSFSFAD